MSSIPDDPLQWSYPKNQRITSCYADSALWAILYKRDNGIYELIRDFKEANFNTSISTCSQNNLENIRKNLVEFYNNIVVPKQNLSDYVTNILTEFAACDISNSKDNWLNEQQDASAVLDIVARIFEIPPPADPTTQTNSNNISLVESRNYVKLSDNSNYKTNSNAQYQSMVILSCRAENLEKVPKDKNFVDTEDTINLFNLKNYQMTNNNTLTITGRIETMDDTENKIEIEDPQTNKKEIVEMKSIQHNYTYSTKDGNPIKSIILNIARFGQFQSGGSNKTNYNVNFPFKIGDLVLSSIIVHNGTTIRNGHYKCYFRVENDWFLMNDTSGIRSVSNIIDEPNISSGCTTLVYFLETYQNILSQIPAEYFCDLFAKQNGGKYPKRILVDDQTAQNELPENERLTLPRSSSAPISSASSQLFTSRSTLGSSSSSGQTPYKDTLNVSPNQSNICEKYGDEWLNLFVSANASSGTIIHTTINGIPLSSVNVQANCTFVPGASQPPPSPPTSPRASSPSSTLEEEADDALEAAKLLTIKSQAVSDRVGKAQKGNNDTDITPYGKNVNPDKDRLENGNLIYFKNAVYVAGYLDSEPGVIKLYKVDDNTICDLNGTKIEDYKSADPFILIKENPTAPAAVVAQSQQASSVVAATAAPGQPPPLARARAKVENIKSIKSRDAPIFEPSEFPKIGSITTTQITTIVNKINSGKNINVYNTEDIKLDIKTVNNFITDQSYVKDDSCFENNGNYYIPITDSSGTTPVIKWYDIYNKSICNIGLNECSQKNKYKFDGGTRRKRNRNIKFGTRKGKGKRNLRKGRKTK